MVVKTFRGMLAHGGQDRIRLSTIKGKVGYRIVKFLVMGKNPATQEGESVMKIYTESQSTIDATIDFTIQALLGVGLFFNAANNYYSMNTQIIFDTKIFNQDVYITHSDTSSQSCNYYLELEVIPLDDAGAEYTTLKDMRQA